MTPRRAIAIYTAQIQRARAAYLSQCVACRHRQPHKGGDTCQDCRYGEPA